MKTAKSIEADTAHTDRAATSRTVNRMLGLDLASWNNIMVGALALAAFAAVVSGVSTYIVIRLQDAEASAAKREFEEYKIEADKKTAQLSADAEASRAEIARANESVAIATQRAAEANERAAELKLALEREIAARQPRHITQQQHDKLVAKLAKISRKGEVSITAKLFDEEAIGFAKELLSAFKEAGFEVKDVRGPMGFGVTGQWILVRDLKRYQTTPSWAGEVQTILKDVLGLEFDGREMDASFKSDIGEVLIAIGSKS